MNSFQHTRPASPRSRPFLLFLPFLALYIAIILILSKNELIIDEPSYLGYVSNLLHGYYSPPPPDIDLWHAPGYPLLITPFVAAGVPLLAIRLLNAVFLYFSVVLIYRLMSKLVSPKMALYAAIAVGCYWLAWKGLSLIMTETFVFFLVTEICWSAYKSFNEKKINNRYTYQLAFFLGYLALTRFLFGYVLLVALLLSAALWIWKRKWPFKKSVIVFAFALVVTLPWLMYTYSLTGRVFYWGNSGGTTLYWISNPHEGEYGEWFNTQLEPNGSIDGNEPGAHEKLEAHHRQIINEIIQYRGVERDDAYKRKAFENIRNHPGKYFKNWLANVSRLLFNVPQSYRPFGLGALLNMTPNLVLVAAMVFLFIPSWRMRRQIPFFIKFLLLVAIIYFGASSLISGTIRMFYILFPILVVWLFYVKYNFPYLRTANLESKI
jgi:4-amino-4-deoxy-L-arabinose transferase-like glycosyltransferase